MNDLTKIALAIDPAPERLRLGCSDFQLPKLHQVPRARYTDEKFYQAELERVFRRAWLQVSHVSEFEKVGSCQTFDLPMDPVVIVREPLSA